MEDRTDIVVVGAGPCGLAVGVAARAAGLDAVLFERGAVVQSLVRYPTYMTFFSTPERLEIGGIPFVVADAKPTRREALAYYRAVAARHALDIRPYEPVENVAGEAGAFVVTTPDRTIRAAAVVVATGAMHAPNLLGIPGEDLPHVRHAFVEAHPCFQRDVVVVGGGSSAVETALACYRSGARVTVVHFEDRFDRGVKPWILPDLENRIEGGEVGVRWRSRLIEIRPGEVAVRSEATGETETLAADHVLAMTGWRSDHEALRALGVDIDPETGVPAHDPETLETNVPGIFLAGVITAGFDANKVFIENGRDHGAAIVRALVARGERRPGDAPR